MPLHRARVVDASGQGAPSRPHARRVCSLHAACACMRLRLCLRVRVRVRVRLRLRVRVRVGKQALAGRYGWAGGGG